MQRQREEKERRFISFIGKRATSLFWLQLSSLVVALGAFFLPALAARYGGSLYYVRGIDLVIGRGVPTDPIGIVPQTTAAFAMLALFLGIAALFIRNQDKAAFLPPLCGVSCLALLFCFRFGYTESGARLDPVIAALGEKRVQGGFYLLVTAVLLVIGAGVVRILARPKLRLDLNRHRFIYIMAVPVLLYVLIFFYYPLYGTLMAFKDYNPQRGILGSPWVGIKHFISFFQSRYFFRLISNTFLISFYSLIFGFSIPILFALFLNEVKCVGFRRVIQTVTYLPHFISLVTICGLLVTFLQREGLVNQLLGLMGVSEESMRNYLGDPRYFRLIYVASDIWQNFGWSSIVYFAAITSIDAELYEAAEVDGAKRFRKMWSVTLPCLAPTVIIMLIMDIGKLMNVGYEKIILLYNTQTYETADVISSFVYRRGIIENDYSFATAVGLFNSLISLVLVVIANQISRRVSETSLW